VLSRSEDRSESWPPEALDWAERLHGQLAIGDRDWHRLKAQRPRRAAEQISAALVRLLASERPGGAVAGPDRQETVALLRNALDWLEGRVSDPGCPEHGLAAVHGARPPAGGSPGHSSARRRSSGE
jgi:DnaJ-domain-containing protein 1